MTLILPRKVSNPVSSKVSNLAPSGIRRFFDLVSTMENVISLGVGEPDFVTPWNIREAAIYSLEKGQTMYTSNSGLLSLRKAIAEELDRLWGLNYNPETEILITVGVSEGLDLANRAILDPDDEVLVPTPCYVAYQPCVVLAGGKPVACPLSEENEFKLRVSDLEFSLTSRTKTLILDFPSNPTGATMSKEELEEIAGFVKKNDLLVISDEIYARLVYEGKHTAFASLDGMKERTVLLGGFSKAYAMTGWRIGYAAGPAQIIAAMTRIHQYTMLCAPVTGQMAALEALKGGDKAIKEMVFDYNRRRRVILKGFRKLGLLCFEPKGAFYIFPSIKSTGLTSDEFAERLLMEEKVAVVPGTAFGPGGDGYIRCCYATSLSDIEEAVKRMSRFLARLPRFHKQVCEKE